MLHFMNDYSEGAHPRVMRALADSNMESTVGYGCDDYCAQAADALRTRFACPDADVHFLVGGTQTNLVACAAFLRPWEAVIAADSGHVAVHETGAIEATGHKVFVVPGEDGRLTAEAVRRAVMEHRTGTEEHMVLPKLVYVSDSTAFGTIYTRAELESLRAVCDELGAALTAEGNDVRPEDFARLCDAFYFGGTKNALLFGEALVIVNEALKPFVRNVIKQRGGMLAKGRLLGVQFGAMLQDDLWLETARHANEMAQRLAKGLEALGVPFFIPSPTNQIFPVFSDAVVAALRADAAFEFWAKPDEGHTAIRFVCSWATQPEQVDAMLACVKARLAEA